MAVAQRIDERTYKQFVLSGAGGTWELHDGRLVEKPGMSWDHGDIVSLLSFFLQQQLNRAEYRVRINEGRLSKPGDTIFIPDIAVVPAAYGDEFRGRPGLAIFTRPLPFVVEVWSPSTGEYDVDAKIPVYKARGDLEIWRIHPYERTLTRWVRQAEETYAESLHRGGVLSPIPLPGVTIDLDHLFES